MVETSDAARLAEITEHVSRMDTDTLAIPMVADLAWLVGLAQRHQHQSHSEAISTADTVIWTVDVARETLAAVEADRDRWKALAIEGAEGLEMWADWLIGPMAKWEQLDRQRWSDGQIVAAIRSLVEEVRRG